MTPDNDGDVWTVGALVLAAFLTLLVVMLSGCSNLSPAIASANATREAAIASGDVLRAVCTEGYERAQTVDDVVRLDRLGCPRAARAHDAVRAAHRSLVAVISAISAGQCQAVVQAPRQCDLAGAIREVIDAAGEMALAADRIQQ